MTLVETLVVMGILAVLAALIFPAMAPSLRASKTSAAVSNLHQLHYALALYQADWTEDAHDPLAVAATLGLPSLEQLSEPTAKASFPTILPFVEKSPCGFSESVRKVNKFAVFYYAVDRQDPESFPDYAGYYHEHPSDGILAIDANCGSPEVNIYDTRFPQPMLGLRLDGGIIRRRTNDRRPTDEVWKQP